MNKNTSRLVQFVEDIDDFETEMETAAPIRRSLDRGWLASHMAYIGLAVDAQHQYAEATAQSLVALERQNAIQERIAVALETIIARITGE